MFHWGSAPPERLEITELYVVKHYIDITIFYLVVEIGRVRKEMETETAKLHQEILLLNQTMTQKEREAQVAMKSKEQSHEEHIANASQQKVQ